MEPDHCDGLTASICHCPSIPAHGLSLSDRDKAPVKQPAALLKHHARSQLGKEYKKVWKKEKKAAQKWCIYEHSTFLASASYSQQEQQRVLIWLLLLFAFTTGSNNNFTVFYSSSEMGFSVSSACPYSGSRKILSSLY